MSKTKDEKLLEKEELKKVKKTQQDEKKKLAAEKKEKKKEEREKKKAEKAKKKEDKLKKKQEKVAKKEDKKKSKVKEDKKTKSNDEVVETEKVVKEKKSIFDLFLKFILLISIGGSIFAIYELFLLDSIENNLRYAAMGVLAFIDLILILRVFIKSKKKKKKHKKKVGTLLFMIFYSSLCIAAGLLINYFYSKLDSINKNIVTYSSSLVTMATDKAEKITDISDYKIAILDDDNSPEGYIIPQEIVSEHKLNDENELVKYSDYSSMVVDLYADEIDAIFISSGYVELFSGLTGYESIETDTKVIISKDKDMKKTETSAKEKASVNKSVDVPFTILLMGIDSTSEVLSKNAVANGDTLILITFNPKTLNATMVSIPRDSYLPIACWPGKDENKITHAAAYGNDCMMNSIEDFFGINIDYYAKINFKGLVKLVNAVGGVEVDVPTTLCTDNSDRSEQVCIHPGRRVLNGEEALVFARNRKSLVNGDFGRAEHQQEIIMALINKMKTITEVSKFTEILNTISNSLDTNLTTKQILSFYNIGKDIIKRSNEASDLINIQQLYLTGASQMIYDERMRMVLYNYVPNTKSRDAIVHAMKVNLEQAEHEVIKEFSFSINKTYEKAVIGKGFASAGTYRLLPNFIGLSRGDAQARADAYGVKIAFEGGTGNVVAQSHPEKKRLDKINGTVILILDTVKEDKPDKDKDKVDKDEETDEDDEEGSETGDGTGEGTGTGSGSGESEGSGSDTEKEPETPPTTPPATEEPKDETPSGGEPTE